jgi:predicted transcriptional regulator
LALSIILGEVAHHNFTRHFASQISVAKTGRLALPVDGLWNQLEGCNAFSLSHATGIPRETVRRKIKQLEKLGWVARSARGDVTITPAVAEFFLPERNLELLTELRATSEVIEQLLANGARAKP